MEMNPTVWLPPTMPLTCHVTALVGDPFKDAVNCCVPKSGTVTALGDTLTESTGPTAVTVTVADADFVLSACDVAVTILKSRKTKGRAPKHLPVKLDYTAG